MKTINKRITMNILIPSAGYLLTQAQEVEPKDRIFSEEIYLAVNDPADNWKEVTIEEAEKLRKELQEEKEPPGMEEL